MEWPCMYTPDVAIDRARVVGVVLAWSRTTRGTHVVTYHMPAAAVENATSCRTVLHSHRHTILIDPSSIDSLIQAAELCILMHRFRVGLHACKYTHRFSQSVFLVDYVSAHSMYLAHTSVEF